MHVKNLQSRPNPSVGEVFLWMLGVLLFMSGTALSGWGQSYSDSFNYTGPLNSSNWTVTSGNFSVSPGAVSGSGASSTWDIAIHTGTFTNDQYQCTTVGSYSGSGDAVLVGVRVTSPQNGYFGTYNGQWSIYSFPSATQLASLNGTAIVVGHKYCLAVAGTSLTLTDQTAGTTLLTATDSTYTSGSPALYAYQTSTNSASAASGGNGAVPVSAANPTFTPAAGRYAGAQSVTLACSTSGTTPSYSTDGGTTFNAYTTAISVSSTTTIQAYCSGGSYVNSDTVSATYQIGALTWYVLAGGGNRSQCDGQANAVYPGTGTNQHCGFGDIRDLWEDGSYATDGSTFPSWGWIVAGGDTVILDCSGMTNGACRVGWNNNSTAYDSPTSQYWGLNGDPYGSNAPPFPSGTSANHTKIYGKNYAACTADSAKTKIIGGFGLGTVFQFNGSSYVDVACLDVSDSTNCTKISTVNPCNTTVGTLSDYAQAGFTWYKTSTHDTLTDVRVHGMSKDGMFGPTGDGVVITRVTLAGNPYTGWDMDPGDGTTGTGTLTLSYLTLWWSGCEETYPLTSDTFPYFDCNDQSSGGQGDGIGTATTTSNPAWLFNVDHSTAAYNTQDGFDLLHLTGNGSRLTITDSLSYSNMGNQLKVGAAGTAINNVLVGNCYAMNQAITGAPSGFNSRLSNFCRGGGATVLMSAGNSSTTIFRDNTFLAFYSEGLQIECDNMNGACDTTALIDFQNNVFLGYTDDSAHGDPAGNGENATPIYMCVTTSDCPASQPLNYNVFGNPGSLFDHNATYGARSNWTCPTTYESAAQCGDPGLTNETWPMYGYNNLKPASGSSLAVGNGIAISGITTDYAGATRPNPPSIGAYEFRSAGGVYINLGFQVGSGIYVQPN